MLMPPKNILVCPRRFIGDAVLTVPLLRALKTHYPDAAVDVLLPPHLINLFEHCPYINCSIVELQGKRALLLLNTIRTRQYDLALVTRKSLTQAMMLRLAGIKTLIGFDKQRFPPPLNYRRWGWFLNYAVPAPPLNTEIPHVKTLLSLLQPLRGGVVHQAVSEQLELWADSSDREKVQRLFQTHGIDTTRHIVLFHATSASREKTMQPEQFVPSLQTLHQYGFQILCLGSQRDALFYEHMKTLAQVPLANLCGQTTLRQSYALLRHVTLVFGLDSGPIHMAAAAGVPHIVGIYGPTNHSEWRPYPYAGQFTPIYNAALSCRPCEPKVCGHNRCRTALTGDLIRQGLEAHLQQMTMTKAPAGHP